MRRKKPSRKSRCDNRQAIISKNTIDQSVDVVGLDGLKRAVQLLYDVRPQTTTFSSIPEISALQQWLIYISMLLDVVACGLAHLVLYRQSLAATFMARPAFEYITRALYFDKYPDEALFELALYHKKSYERAIKDGADADEVEQWRVAAERYRSTCPGVDTPKRKLKTVLEMLRALREGGDDGFEVYRWLYKFPSQVMHATADAMPRIHEFDENSGYSGNIALDPEQITELIRDMARYVLKFVEVYDCRFASGKAAAIQDLIKAHRWLVFDSTNEEHGDGAEALNNALREEGWLSDVEGNE